MDDKKENKIIIVLVIAIVTLLVGITVFIILVNKDNSNNIPLSNDTNNTVKEDINEYVLIPTAIKTLHEGDKIKEEDIEFIKVKREDLGKNVIINRSDVIGKYVSSNMTIVKGGVFTLESITDKSDSNILDDNDDMLYYNINANYNGASNLRVNDIVDIYYKYQDNNQNKYGILIENSKVVFIRDDKGKEVNFNDVNVKISEIIVSVSRENYNLLFNSYYVPNSQIIAIKGSYDKEDNEILVDKKTIEEYINNNSKLKD